MASTGVRGDDGFQRIGREVKFEGRFISVYVDHVRFPGGHEPRHEVMHLPSAVAIVPILEEEGREPEVVLVEQFRTALDGFIHEIPAGIIEEGEDPAVCARRELAEETGYSAERILPLTTLFPIPGTSNHLMYFFLAEGLVPGKLSLEESEVLTVKRFPLEALVRGLLHPAAPSRETSPVAIVDGKSHIGILHAFLRRKEHADKLLPER